MTERALLGGSSGDGNGVGTASTSFYFAFTGRPALGSVAGSTTEAHAQNRLRAAATLKNLHIVVTTNGRSTATVVKLRQNGADTALAISVGAGLTGTFADTTNTVSGADGDLIGGVGTTGTGSGTFTMMAATLELNAAAAFAQLGFGLAAAGFSYTSSGGTTYWGFGCAGNTAGEGRLQARAMEAAVLSRLGIYVDTNARANAATLRLRKNTANGNQVVTIGAGLTGWFEDTTNSDNIVDGDLVNLSLTHGAGTEAFNFRTAALKYVGGANVTWLATSMAGNALGAGVTNFYAARGYNNGGGATENRHQFAAAFNGTLSRAAVRVDANASTTTVTFVLRKNGADTALSIAVGAGLTGNFTDLSNTVDVDRTDLLNWKASGATTGALTLGTLSVLFTADAVVDVAGFAVGSPAFGSPVVTQAHALAVPAFAIGSPVLGSPAITQVHALAVSAFAVSSPAFGGLTLTQAHALAVAAFAVGSPAFGSVAISQVHALALAGFACGSPVFGSPTITQAHVLTCGGLVVSGPVFGTITLRHLRQPKASLTGAPRGGSLTGVSNRDVGG